MTIEFDEQALVCTKYTGPTNEVLAEAVMASARIRLREHNEKAANGKPALTTQVDPAIVARIAGN